MASPADQLPQGDLQVGEAQGSEASPELGLLKRLLFRNEQSRLDALHDRTEALAARVGDNARFEQATAEVLAGALRRAEVANHRELSHAIAPLVIAAIRSEIVNSRDLMVEALYPITGRLVSAAVAAAFRDLVANINARLDRLLSTQIWRLRLRALLTGRPMSEILMEAAQRPQVRLLLAMERDSGRLLANWRAEGPVNESPELIGGMIAAISQFATEAFSREHGELRTLDMGASRILLRASARLIVAAEFLGEPYAGDEQRMDRTLYALIEDAPEGPTDANLARLAADFASPLERKASGKLKLALGLLVLLATFWAWHGRCGIFCGSAGCAQPMRMPWPGTRGWRPGRCNCRSTAPRKSPPFVASRRQTLTWTRSLRRLWRRGRLIASRRRSRGSRRRQGWTRRRRRSASRPLALKGAIEGLGERLDGSDRWRAAREAEAQAPARALAALAGMTTIEFGDELDYADPVRAKSQIAALAAQLKASGFGLRIVGYSDQAGSATANIKLSQQRAEQVAAELVAEGVESSKLVSVGRGVEAAVAAPGGPQRRQNRRVTFEMLTPAEPGE
jgi:outer membrane protein OmpA-like peptidoglycan-associated protein